jgi:hypothetical protein
MPCGLRQAVSVDNNTLLMQVGIVRQVETAAIKKAGDNKAGPFERRLTALHTAATLEVRACLCCPGQPRL